MAAEDVEKSADGSTAVAFRTILVVYGVAIFLSAALLFAVQPIFTKMVLPKLGGSAAVWSVAMVFFQAVLLAGYAYAHLLTRYVPTRHAVILHVVVMLAAIVALPLGIAEGWDRPPTENESLWLLGLFAVSIGLPFFALSANAPLLAGLVRARRSSARGRSRISSTPRAISAASSRCSAIRSWSSRSPGSASRPAPGRSRSMA